MWYRFATAPTILRNPVIGGFWVDNDFIEYGKPLNKSEWKALLKTAKTNIKDQEHLNLFLLDHNRFEEKKGRKTYVPNSRVIPLTNSIVGGFWYNGDHIPEGKTEGIKSWMRILKSNIGKANSQKEFENFLNSRIVIDANGNKIFQNYYDNIKLINTIGEFYAQGRKIENNESLYVNQWVVFLQTHQPNINNQEKLDLFLSNADFKIDKNGNRIYVPKKTSFRENQFQKNINISDEHNIIIVSQKKVQSLSDSGKSERILRLDFALIKDEKILLAIEINGGQHYGFVSFKKDGTYKNWQNALQRDIEKINYCHNNNIPLIIFHHLLSQKEFKTIIDNLNKNPHVYDKYIPQPVMDNSVTNTSLEFIKRQIYSHLYPVFSNVISFENDESRKRYIKDTLILISKLMGIYEGGIDSTDYIKSFSFDVDLTANYNICLAIYNSLYPDFPLDKDEKITYSDLSKTPRLQKEKSPIIEPAENLIPSEE